VSRINALLILLLAALLEAGGDAVVRLALRSSAAWIVRLALFVVGAAVLLAYGYAVNAPPWDFGRLLGIYVVLFFVVAQIISWVVFHQPPARGTLAGGLLIVAGGVVISLFP
jgi:small multidrug resistance family-3 protein